MTYSSKALCRIRMIALLLLLALLASCTGNPSPESPSGTAPTIPEVPTDEPVSASALLISGGAYTLTRPDKASDNILTIFLMISNQLAKMQGSRFAIGTDFVKDGEQIPQNAHEILLGNTNRNASRSAMQELKTGEWLVCVRNGQIIIVGENELVLDLAARAFLAACTVSSDGKIYVPDDLELKGSISNLDNASRIPIILPDSQTALVVTSSDGKAYTPEWVNDLIIVEANLVNASPNGEGTLEAARQIIDHLATLGVNGLWITPIGDRSDQKYFYGNLGLHTIDQKLTGTSDYEQGWQKFTDFVSYAHSKNVRVFMDVVTWGTSADSELLILHPDWYTGKNAWSGKEFNWNNAELREWYTQTAVDLILKTGVDGLRCDCEPEYAGYSLFADIRERCLQAGRKIIIFSEHSNSRDGAFDFEQFGVFDYNTCSFSEQQDRKLNWFMRNTSIVAAIRNSTMIGSTQKEIQNKTAYYRYFTYCVSCHDFSGTAVNGNILTLAYQALFAPFIPIWYLGEEFGWNGSGSLLYAKVNWKDAENPQNHDFQEQVKQLIAIRRDYADIFSCFAENHRESNICVVPTTGFGSLTAYARYHSDRAILIVPNTSGTDAASGKVVIPFSSMKMNATEIWRIRDLLTNEIIAEGIGSEISGFTTTINNNSLGVYLVEKR